jgi:hypothetical protein
MDKIYTSYFANLKNLPDNVCLISICGKAPDWYTGIQYKALAPKYWFFKKYKEDGDEEFYTLAFQRDVCGALNAYATLLDLQKLAGDKIPCLLCYEKPGDFCHRHIVAEWLHNNLGVHVEEFNGTVR